jgi:rubrerythrin
MADDVSLDDLNFGTEIFDDEGRTLGHIRGFDESGFYVSFAEGLEGLSVEHVAPRGSFGEAELMWRCWECGALGELDGSIPESCPDCGARKEDLYYWVED